MWDLTQDDVEPAVELKQADPGPPDEQEVKEVAADEDDDVDMHLFRNIVFPDTREGYDFDEGDDEYNEGDDEGDDEGDKGDETDEGDEVSDSQKPTDVMWYMRKYHSFAFPGQNPDGVRLPLNSQLGPPGRDGWMTEDEMKNLMNPGE